MSFESKAQKECGSVSDAKMPAAAVDPDLAGLAVAVDPVAAAVDPKWNRRPRENFCRLSANDGTEILPWDLWASSA